MRSVLCATLVAAIGAMAWAFPGFMVRLEYYRNGTVLEVGTFSQTPLTLKVGGNGAFSVWSEAYLGKTDLALGGWWKAGVGLGVQPDIAAYIGGGLALWMQIGDWDLRDVYFAGYIHVFYLWREAFSLGVRLTLPRVLDLNAPLGGPFVSFIVGLAF